MANPRPVGKFVLIQLDPKATKTKGGIALLPAGLGRDEDERPVKVATALAFGDDVTIPNTDVLVPGDRIYISKHVIVEKIPGFERLAFVDCGGIIGRAPRD